MVRTVLTSLTALLAAALAVPSFWLLLSAWTRPGRVIGLTGLSVALAVVALLLTWRNAAHRQTWSRVAALLGLIVGGLGVALLLTAPSGRPGPASPVHHRFAAADSVRFRPYRPTNVIPEAEQIRLGFLVMPALDPILTRGQSRRVAAITRPIYAEMEEDADFRELGSVMGWAYAELAGRPFDVGHYYLYVPKARPPDPLPLVVFLHGSAGNFKAYTWLWAQAAEREGFAVIAPSFGFGNWSRPGGAESALAALDDVLRDVAIDEERIYLAGLSNGGLGVSHVAARAQERFRGLIFISPVIADILTNRLVPSGTWDDCPVLVITGEADRRIPVGYVEEHARRLQVIGADVTLITYPGEDHFLFFSQKDQIMRDIGLWLSAGP
jgi:pimeloyl-ACP methyl ester carboxylesterase